MVLLVTIVLVYVRLFIGVDFTDEAFYNSLPYSFVLGLRPYRDELNLAQNAGILLTPFFQLYHSIVGSSFGLVLFNRHLYFALLAVCSFLSFRVATGYVGRNFGRLLAAFVLTFSYFNIPSLSYNTIGALFLFIGLFLLLTLATLGSRSHPHWLIFGANSCFVVSAFGYPTLLLSSLAGFGVSLWLSERTTPVNSPPQVGRNRIAWGATLVLGLAGALAFLACFRLDHIGASLAYAGSRGYDLTESAMRGAGVLGEQLWRLRWYFLGLAALLALPILPARSFRNFRSSFFWAILTSFAILLLLIHRQPSLATYPTGSSPLLLCFGLLLPLALVLLPDRRQGRELLVVICLPAFLAAVAIALYSTNGLMSATLGLFPASVGCLLCVAMIASSIDRDVRSNGIRVASVSGALIPLLVFQVYCLLEYSYRDAPFASGVRSVFASGPFAGLVTTEAKTRRLDALTADLNSLGDSARTIFICGQFPAGYLLSPLKPRTFSTWVFWPEDAVFRAQLLRRVFAAAEAPPDVILQVGPRPAWVDVEVQRLKYRVHRDRREFDYVLLLRERP